ncbi:MAG: circadian clock protein KaiC, partial [Spirochaetota bacterium]|nr:circadian clock protein KaiC [Spirochaetota bacterium]
MIDYSFIEDLKKIPTGIKGFEHLSNGGLTQNRTTLVCGTSGAGKTLFVIEILYRGITQYNRPGIFVTFEERPKAIVQNVKSLNWGLVKLIKEKKLMFVDASPEPDPVLEIGEYDLSGLLIQIKEAIKEINAEIVVMDSIGALFGQFTNTQLIRTEMLRITEELKKCGVTTVITAERLEEYGTISRHGIEEFLSDNVIVLRNVLEEEKCRRTIQILKVRGDTHIQGEFPFIISSTGFNIMSLTAIELIQTSSLKKVSTGNKKLDEITNGGIFQDSVFLVSGPTGGGKTLMSTIFASAACKNNEKTLLLAYEESREQLLRNAISWGINFEEWEKKN